MNSAEVRERIAGRLRARSPDTLRTLEDLLRSLRLGIVANEAEAQEFREAIAEILFPITVAD